MKEGNKKGKWNQQHILITSLDRQEVERRLRNETILDGEWVARKNRENYLFHMGRVKDNAFEIYPNQRRMPPRSERGRPLPKVCGIMSATAAGGTAICIWLEEPVAERVFSVVLDIVFGVSFLIDFLIRSDVCWFAGWVLIRLLILCIKVKYREFVSRRVLEWLTKLWDAAESLISFR